MSEVSIENARLCDASGNSIGVKKSGSFTISLDVVDALALCGEIVSPVAIPLLMAWDMEGRQYAIRGKSDFSPPGPFQFYLYTRETKSEIDPGEYFIVIFYLHSEMLRIDVLIE